MIKEQTDMITETRFTMTKVENMITEEVGMIPGTYFTMRGEVENMINEVWT